MKVLLSIREPFLLLVKIRWFHDKYLQTIRLPLEYRTFSIISYEGFVGVFKYKEGLPEWTRYSAWVMSQVEQIFLNHTTHLRLVSSVDLHDTLSKSSSGSKRFTWIVLFGFTDNLSEKSSGWNKVVSVDWLLLKDVLDSVSGLVRITGLISYSVTKYM